ncbi:MAG TPA: rhombosortase [Steroidobacteraceae bacterium]|jgi:rhomboid family GlyGly-CTERM serine protease|nr:rhombosortase [Steroidobacteraceae bacterium]
MGISGFVNHVHLALRSVNCDGRRGLALLCICLLLLLLTALGGDAGQGLLRYERGALSQGQFWRLLSAHLVHLDLRHALLNAAGLALVWALFARDYSPKAWLAILLGTIAAIDAGLWLGDSTVQWYVGSSGALHGAMAAGALAHIRHGERDGWVLAALLAAKLLYEQTVGALPFSGRDPVVVDAHLYGVLGGAAVAAFLKPRRLPL